MKRCVKGVWDETIPGISFDENGVSNFCKLQESLMDQYPRGEKGLQDWQAIVDKMKKDGLNKKYDCILGVSGGTDSSYLLHIAKEYGLRVLGVNLDNGWSSKIAVENIKNMMTILNYDLETYVINYQEVTAVLRSYVLAGLPWIDSPTDIAIKSTLYKVASREGIKHVMNGSDFRSEGKQPLSWTYSDTKQLKYIVNKFEKITLKTYPIQPLYSWMYYGFIRKINVIRPLYYLPYMKKSAKELLKEKYGWIDYGGHHHENIFTKFAISYWLPEKFNIDKRLITYSAQILSNEISRDEALSFIAESPFQVDKIDEDITYVIKKLGISKTEFDNVFNGPNKYFYDYPSFYPLIKRYAKIGKFISNKIFGFKPGIFEAIEQKI